MSDSLEGPEATIDLGALRHNVVSLRSRTAANTLLMAAVKADAYGHGVRVVAALQSFGVDRFGVATAGEALALREAGVTAPLLVFGPVRRHVADLVGCDVALTVPDRDALEAIVAADPGRRAQVHVKLDTGMGRLGVRSEEALGLARAVDRSRACDLEGVWTHLAASDEPAAAADSSHTGRQLARFEAALALLEADGLRPPIAHAANSAALVLRRDAHYDMVRPGIAVYGHHASATVRAAAPELVPALTLSAPVTFVKRVRRGDTVGYGAGWSATSDTSVATVRLGYADGYPRSLGNLATMRLHDREVGVVGSVCMDQLMLDVGALSGVAPGDTAIAFGRRGPDTEGLAGLAGTVSYELLTRLSPRVERRYVEEAAEPA